MYQDNSANIPETIKSSSFAGNLSEEVNDLQTLAERVDQLDIPTLAGMPITTAANDVIVGDGAGAWITKTIAQFVTILRTSLDAIYSAAAHTHSIYILHSLATAANDFLIASGSGKFIKNTLAETKTVLGLGSAAYTASTDYVTHALATAANDFLVASGAGTFAKKTLSETKTVLGLPYTYTHPNHTGDVTSVADGAQTIANDAVTYAKMQNISAQWKFHGRKSAGAGDTEEVDFQYGTYTPTLTNTTNIAASTAYACQFIRIGTVVTVSGMVNVDPTSTGSCVLGMSLPIASNIAAIEQCAGVGNVATATAFTTGVVYGSIAADTAVLQWIATDVTAKSCLFTFTYLIV
jgi:hypothetical protein